MTTSTMTKDELARTALDLYIKIAKFEKELDGYKDELRSLANGNKLDIEISGLGSIIVGSPRVGSESIVLVFDESKLDKASELRAKLIAKGIAKEEVKKVSPAKASVTIKPNV